MNINTFLIQAIEYIELNTKKSHISLLNLTISMLLGDFIQI